MGISLKNYPVIVTDGLWRKSLSAIRALGKAGFEVHVLGDSLLTTGFWSRYCHRRWIAPTAARDPEGFGAALLACLRSFPRERPPVLLPMEDATLIWISRHREKLVDLARFAIPDDEKIAMSEDKSLTLAFAENLGLPVPRTIRPKSPEALVESLTAWGGDDWVVKPSSGSGSTGVVYGSRASVLGSGPEALPFWRKHWQRHGALLVQERIPPTGRAIGASFLMGEGSRVLARFTHERIQQYPISGGPSTDRKSIHHAEIEAWSEKLLREAGWKGVAMVEWKSDPRDGSFKLMEINPRFWGSLELAVRAGVDFPVLYARLSLGETESLAPASYSDGARCRWMIPGEILRYLGTPRKQREPFREFLRGLPALAEEWDRSDLRGAFAALACTAALALHPRYWRYLRRG